jgi:iron(III) transport system ATP-binding protein
MKITLRNVTKRFGDYPVLNNVSLEVGDQELFFLLGPSGCGKTTILRLIAGFYEPDEGDVLFDNDVVNFLPPNERRTGMVFQNYALWPHLSVFDNVGYGLDVRKTDKYERDRRVGEALQLVRMDRFANRAPNELSGGQQQRVALARALVIKPRVLLLDEPLSNLDARLRIEMRDEIRRIHSEKKITTIYVTHDQRESLSLANRIAVMNEGRIAQLGDPRGIYRNPNSRFVADFIGETNWLEGIVDSSQDRELTIRTPLGHFSTLPQPALKAGVPVWIGFRPESLRCESASVNSFQARLEQSNYMGESEEYLLKTDDGTSLKALQQNPDRTIPIGSTLGWSVKAADILVQPRTPKG